MRGSVSHLDQNILIHFYYQYHRDHYHYVMSLVYLGRFDRQHLIMNWTDGICGQSTSLCLVCTTCLCLIPSFVSFTVTWTNVLFTHIFCLIIYCTFAMHHVGPFQYLYTVCIAIMTKRSWIFTRSAALQNSWSGLTSEVLARFYCCAC